MAGRPATQRRMLATGPGRHQSTPHRNTAQEQQRPSPPPAQEHAPWCRRVWIGLSKKKERFELLLLKSFQIERKEITFSTLIFAFSSILFN